MPWYEPKYGPNSNFLVHFKELDNSQEKKQIEPKQETKSETPNKKTQKKSSFSRVRHKKDREKDYKRKKPTTKTKVTPSNLFKQKKQGQIGQ